MIGEGSTTELHPNPNVFGCLVVETGSIVIALVVLELTM